MTWWIRQHTLVGFGTNTDCRCLWNERLQILSQNGYLHNIFSFSHAENLVQCFFEHIHGIMYVTRRRIHLSWNITLDSSMGGIRLRVYLIVLTSATSRSPCCAAKRTVFFASVDQTYWTEWGSIVPVSYTTRSSSNFAGTWPSVCNTCTTAFLDVRSTPCSIKSASRHSYVSKKLRMYSDKTVGSVCLNTNGNSNRAWKPVVFGIKQLG